METVRVFNQELSGLYESKPPISKAKMASITRSAMKAIKFYKHVVQSVEKFIQKCKCEYKIPGLYVIDSIVRQSRHQFGPEKDVFAPRFARNMESTFAHLFRCPPEDKSKIIRVLNLWQKNMVFLPEVIQPLFDLANPDHPIHQQYNAQLLQEQAGANGMNPGGLAHDSPVGGPMGGGMEDHGGQLQMGETKQLDPSTIRQLQQFQQILMRQTSGDQANAAAKDQVKFNKKLLDFDYGSDDDDDKNSPSVPMPSNAGMPDMGIPQVPAGNIAQILSDPNVLKQLQNLQKLKQQEEKQTKLNEMLLKEEKFEKHLASVLMKLPFANECDLSRQPTIDLSAGHSSAKDVDTDNDVAITGVEILGEPMPVGGSRGGVGLGSSGGPSSSGNNDRYKSSSSSSRRKSRSRSPRDRRGGGGSGTGGRSGRGRSHSRSRSVSPRSSRRRSSRDRGGTSAKDREREKEHERERKRKGLPEMKKEHLSVCSTTLWVGHLSKLVQQEELSDTFGKYGDIVSIDMIPPRGCAFIVMNRRQDAFKCMQALKNHKMHGRAITISWAAGKGVKSKEWKDYWDLDLGVSYIPWPKLTPSTDLESLEDGGMFDEDTMPQWMKEKSSAGGTPSLGPAAAVAAAAMGLGLGPSMGMKKLDGSDLSSAAAAAAAAAAAGMLNPSLFPLGAVDTSQPPPTAMLGMGMPPFPMTRLPIPMGIPMGPNMVPGLGINVPPPGMMLPNNPPPLPMGGFGVLPPPPPSSNSSSAVIMGNGASSVNLLNTASNMSKSSADDMDIEMEDEHHPPNAAQMVGGQGPAAFFNQPPPPLMPPSANLPPGPPGSVGFFAASSSGSHAAIASSGNMQDNGGPIEVPSDDGDGDAGGSGRGARGFLRAGDDERDHLRGRGGDRSRDRDQRGGSGFERGSAADVGGRRDRGERGSRWGGGNERGGGNNFRGGSGNNNQDDRPLSERLRELAGVLDFNNQQQRGGRNFGPRGNDGDDFNNREADFTRRGGNFQQNRFNNNASGGNSDGGGGRGDAGGGRNQGRNGPFSNQQQGGGRGGNNSGMFGNRAGGGRNNNQQQHRGGQFFNEDRQQQGAFFDRDEGSNGYDSGGNNGNNNRRNWNDRPGGGRGNNGGNREEGNRGRGRQQNWRSGDESTGSGDGGSGQRFNNARGGNNRGANGNRPGAARWDDDDENWDDSSNRSTTGRPAQFTPSKRQRRQSGDTEEQDSQSDHRREAGSSVAEDMMLDDDQLARHPGGAEHDAAEEAGMDNRNAMNRQDGSVDNSADRRFRRDHRNDEPDDERPQPILYSPEPEEEYDQPKSNVPSDLTGNDFHHEDNRAETRPRELMDDHVTEACGDEFHTPARHPSNDTPQFCKASDKQFESQMMEHHAEQQDEPQQRGSHFSEEPVESMERVMMEESNDFRHLQQQQQQQHAGKLELANDNQNEVASLPPSDIVPCLEQHKEPFVQSNDDANEDSTRAEIAPPE